MRILFLTVDLESNATGRTYALWTLARAAGWATDVVAPSGDHVWGPVADTEFAQDCRVVSDRAVEEASLLDAARAADLIVVVKPLPGTYDRALRLRRMTGTPLLLDIDDPSLEVRLNLRKPLRVAGRAVLRAKSFWQIVRLAIAAKRERHVMVSNPVLQRRWGGAVVPHARPDTGQGIEHTRPNPEIVFVGTNNPHKGVSMLRQAVADCQHLGVTLTVTDEAPDDAHPWERWTGQTSLSGGLDLVRRGDIVVLPSVPGQTYPEAQLPVKAIDAMVAGRAVVVSNLVPLTWALDGTGVVVEEYSSHGFAAAIASMCDPALRQSQGVAARARALEHFSVEGVLPVFRAACTAAAGID